MVTFDEIQLITDACKGDETFEGVIAVFAAPSDVQGQVNFGARPRLSGPRHGLLAAIACATRGRWLIR